MTDNVEAVNFYQDQLVTLVKSGFFNEDALDQYLEDLEYDEDAKSLIPMLTEFGEIEIQNKKALESNWPRETDCDHLGAAFNKLEEKNILTLHNSGFTTSDSHGDAWRIIRKNDGNDYIGFCFYHAQDTERAVLNRSLFLGFDSVQDSIAAKKDVGDEVHDALVKQNLNVIWDGEPETRLLIDPIDWKWRTDWVKHVPDTPVDPSAEIRKDGVFLKLFGRQ